jgi:hypothetical protein
MLTICFACQWGIVAVTQLHFYDCNNMLLSSLRNWPLLNHLWHDRNITHHAVYEENDSIAVWDINQ